MTNSVDIRAHVVDVFRRDLVGPGRQDADLANERLNESPARWYLAGFLAPAEDPLALDGDDDENDPSAQEEMEIDVEEPDADGVVEGVPGGRERRDERALAGLLAPERSLGVVIADEQLAGQGRHGHGGDALLAKVLCPPLQGSEPSDA